MLTGIWASRARRASRSRLWGLPFCLAQGKSKGKTPFCYIGNATGVGGIWARWCEYAWTGHGHNVELVSLLAQEGASYAENFQYGVLEIADTHASVDEILRRESHWKDLLCTRFPHGYNAN